MSIVTFETFSAVNENRIPAESMLTAYSTMCKMATIASEFIPNYIQEYVSEDTYAKACNWELENAVEATAKGFEMLRKATDDQWFRLMEASVPMLELSGDELGATGIKYLVDNKIRI